jgi:hypothetical protein
MSNAVAHAFVSKFLPDCANSEMNRMPISDDDSTEPTVTVYFTSFAIAMSTFAASPIPFPKTFSIPPAIPPLSISHHPITKSTSPSKLSQVVASFTDASALLHGRNEPIHLVFHS